MISNIQIGPFDYKVIVDEAAIDRESVRMHSDLQGCCRYIKCEIHIRPGQSPDSEADTLLHEVLHAVFDMTGLGHDLAADDLDESVIRRLTPALLGVIRANPELVKYLHNVNR